MSVFDWLTIGVIVVIALCWVVREWGKAGDVIERAKKGQVE